jgi:hypothetical protein
MCPIRPIVLFLADDRDQKRIIGRIGHFSDLEKMACMLQQPKLTESEKAKLKMKMSELTGIWQAELLRIAHERAQAADELESIQAKVRQLLNKGLGVDDLGYNFTDLLIGWRGGRPAAILFLCELMKATVNGLTESEAEATCIRLMDCLTVIGETCMGIAIMIPETSDGTGRASHS